MHSTDEYRDKLAFLLQAVPSLMKCSKLTKDRVCRSLRPVNIPLGHTLIREGEFLKVGYLIRKGEVELYSRRNLRLVGYIEELKGER